MGSKVSSFTEKQLEEYQESTFFTRKEVIKIFERFRKLAPNIIPTDMKSGNECKTLKIPASIVKRMPELMNNPFNQRICEVFSDDGSGALSFDNFLDMLSVFSEVAPRDIKTLYAFKIYDFDGDSVLNRQDLENTAKAVTKDEMTEDELHFVVNKVLEEVDLDDDGSLSYLEFEHVISRVTGFEKLVETSQLPGIISHQKVTNIYLCGEKVKIKDISFKNIMISPEEMTSTSVK